MIQTYLKKILPLLFLFVLCFSGKKATSQIQFNAAVDSGCAPLNVQFSSNLPLPLYLWDFGDGITSLLQNPSHVYMNPGSYTVKLFITGLTGITDSLIRSNYITVAGDPVASFHINNPNVCQNSALAHFTNTSQNATEFIWDFGDGTTSTQANPSHLYANPGNYTVQLIAENSFGCTDIKVLNNAVHVTPQPELDFSASPTVLCMPQNQTTFTNLTSSCIYQQWLFGDGASSLAVNPSHTYTAPGNYNVTLIARTANGCEDTLTKTAYISVIPASGSPVSTNVTTGCTPLTVSFSTVNATSYLWNFGNGNTSAAANPTFTYTSPGLYDVSVTLTKPNGCVETTQTNGLINIPEPATALFSVDTNAGCAPLVCNFTNLSQNASSYRWSFGDGQYSTAVNPTHIYNNYIANQVVLQAYNSAECASVYTHTAAIVSSHPNSEFTAPSLINCAPFTVSFNNASTAGAVSYFWDFGDGSTSTLMSPTHTFTNPGTFTIKLVSYNSSGCTDTLIRINYITVINPTVNYTAADTLTGCAPYTVAMNDSTFGASSWLWNFGDGTSSTLRNPVHTYTQSGLYTITLNIGLNGGCTQFYSSFKYVNVSAVHAGFTYTYDCLTNTVSFTDTTAGVVSSSWNFHDGSTSGIQNPLHTYPSAGMYNLTWSVSNAQGCSEVLSFINLLNLQPCPDGDAISEGVFPPSSGTQQTGLTNPPGTPTAYSQVQGCIPLTTHFSYPFSSGTPLLWLFGDNSSSNATNPEHVYATAGVYTVLLVYQQANGTIDTVSYSNLISVAGPRVSFSTSLHSDCVHYTVSTINNSSNGNQYIWNFGDATTSTAFAPSHTYSGNQVDYTISLQAIDTVSGCSSQQSTTLFLSNNNVIWASKYITCVPSSVSFYFSSASYVSYAWDFGDNTTSNQQNPVHAYTTEGIYTVKLTVTDGFGCSRVFVLPQNIQAYNPIADFNYIRSGDCSQYEINFINLSAPLLLGSNGYCQWNFGDGTLSSQYLPNVTHVYTHPGTYQVKLKVVTSGGCVSQIIKTVVVNTLQAEFSMQQNRDCFPMTVSFTDLTSNASGWEWNFGNGQNSSQQHPSVNYTQMPADSIRLIVSDYRGCKDTLLKKDFHFFHDSILISTDSACVYSPVAFSSHQDSVSLHWTFGDGSISALPDPHHAYTAAGTYAVQLICTDADGCRDTAHTSIYTSTPISGFATIDTVGCAPLFVHFTNASAGAQSWLWDFGDGSGSTNSNPSHIYNTPGVYTVKLISFNSLGCSDTMIILNYVKILGPVVSFIISNDTICAGMSVGMQINASDVASWQWNFGDGAGTSASNPSHLYAQPGHYMISVLAHDVHGCSAFFADSSLFVSPNPVADYAADTLSRCTPAAVHFSNYSSGSTLYAWDFGNSTTATTSQPPVPVYTAAGSYTTSLVVKNTIGCSDTAQLVLQIQQSPRASFHSTDTSMCAGSMFQLINTSTDTLHPGYSWSISTGFASSAFSPSLSMNNSGAHTVSLIVTNANGCSDTSVRTNYLHIADSLAPAINPIKVVSVSSDTSVLIKWEQATCSDFYAYVLFKKNNSTGSFSPVDTITNIQTTSYLNAGLNTLRYPYEYKLQTIDICGYKKQLAELISHRSIEISAIVLPDNNIRLNWNAYTGCTISGYKIERSESGSVFTELAIVPKEKVSYIDSLAFCPLKFIYRITAMDVCGAAELSYSDTSAAKPANIFKNQKVDIIRSTVINNSSVFTEWAPPAVMPGAVSSFKLFRKENTGGYQFIASVPGNQTSYTDTEVDVNKATYEYKILIVNHCNLASGEGQKGESILLQAHQNEFSTDLKWTPYSSWDSGVDYYIIERKNANGEWEQIKTTDGNTTNTTIEED